MGSQKKGSRLKNRKTLREAIPLAEVNQIARKLFEASAWDGGDWQRSGLAEFMKSQFRMRADGGNCNLNACAGDMLDAAHLLHSIADSLFEIDPHQKG